MSQDGISFRVSMPHVSHCKLLLVHAYNLDMVHIKRLPPGESAAPAQVLNDGKHYNLGNKTPSEESVHVVDQVLQMGLESRQQVWTLQQMLVL
jgi:hypothetical protein